MARGDFRSTAGQVIAAGSRQVHSANTASARYRPNQVQGNAVADGVLQGLKYAANELAQHKARAEREKEREQNRQKSLQQNRAEYERRKKESAALYKERKENEAEERHTRTIARATIGVRSKQTLQSWQEALPAILNEKPEYAYMTAAELIEADGRVKFSDFSGIDDPTAVEAARIEEAALLEGALASAASQMDKQNAVNSFTELTDASIDEDFSNFGELLEMGQAEGLSEGDMWTSFAVSGKTAALEGNIKAVVPLIEKAKEINDPELRDKMLRELTPLTRGMTQRTLTNEHLKYLQSQTTVEGVKAVKEQLGDLISASKYNSNLARVEVLEAKDELFTEAESVFANTGYDFGEYKNALGASKQFTGEHSGTQHKVELTGKEIDQMLNRQFLSMQEQNPNAIPQILANSTTVPKVFTDNLGSFLDDGLLTGEADVTGNSYKYMMQAIQSVGGDVDPLTSAAQLTYKYGLKGKKKLAVEIALSKKDNVTSLEKAFNAAFKTVQTADEFTPREIANYDTALDTEMSGMNLSPRQMKIARESLRINKYVYGKDKAVESAIAAAEARVVNVGEMLGGWLADGIPVFHGDKFVADANALLGDYVEATPEDLLEGILEKNDISSGDVTVEYMPVYNGKRQADPELSRITIMTLDKFPIRMNLNELKEAAGDIFTTYDLTRENKRSHGDESRVNPPKGMNYGY